MKLSMPQYVFIIKSSDALRKNYLLKATCVLKYFHLILLEIFFGGLIFFCLQDQGSRLYSCCQ